MTHATIVKRLVRSNFVKIESDARCALPDGTVFDLVQYENPEAAAALVVNNGPFAGSYRIIKHRAGRWLGDNGYTFERDLNAADTVVLNERYSDEDRRNATDDHDVRETHFARLAEKIRLNRYPSTQPTKEPAAPPADATPKTTEHPMRQRVIDRALEAGVKVTDRHVSDSATLRTVALDYVRTYRGRNSFVQDIAIKLADFGTLTIPQMRGALNVMIAEARIARDDTAALRNARRYADTRERELAQLETAAAREVVTAVARLVAEPSIDQAHTTARAVPSCDVCRVMGRACADHDGREPAFSIDLRSRTDREIEDAGDAAQGAEPTNVIEPAIPNGTYTVLLDSGAYRTLRVKNAPDHFSNCKPGTQILEYLSGPDNTRDFSGFAFLAGRKVSIWSRYRTNEHSLLRRAADLLVVDPMSAAAEYVRRSSRCFVCNRVLTTPESIARGIGPICAESIGAMGFVLALKGDRDSAAEENTLRDALAAHDAEQSGNSLLNVLKATVAERDRGAAYAQAKAAIDELFPE